LQDAKKSRRRKNLRSASERIVDGEPWKEIPEDHLLTIEAQLRASLRPIPA
jgi:predicted glutamine amidotransferase